MPRREKRKRAGEPSELVRTRVLARSLAEIDGGEDSLLGYLRKASEALAKHLGADVVAWDLRRAEPALAARADTDSGGLTWTVHTLCSETLPIAAPPWGDDDCDPAASVFPLGRSGELGSLKLRRRDGAFGEDALASAAIAADTVSAVLVNRITRTALRERVKELGCLYKVARIAELTERPFDETLSEIARALPEAWQHVDVAAARIELDGRCCDSRSDWIEESRISADIVVRGVRRGAVHVVYRAPRPPSHEGPFLREERSLIEALALELAGIVERREVREERSMLEDQIRHADRLATIGQLAAGVAHELNEPLGAVLGFSELLGSSADLPERSAADVRKIIDACLRARDIVNKLRLFARQTPPQRQRVDLNRIINEGLYFTEAQCARQHVRIVRDLDADLPEIDADAGQMYQLLTNLTVNAMQAMPGGGDLIIRTRRREREIALLVNDTGMGMDADTKRKIFVPFFTTKPPDQGTGLGLSVVHGIVVGHGGVVEVESAPGEGTTFEVRLPRVGAERVPRKDGN
jgi:two-component system, NtrC family, sensor kinase